MNRFQYFLYRRQIAIGMWADGLLERLLMRLIRRIHKLRYEPLTEGFNMRKIEKFTQSNMREALKMIKCGFELETQASGLAGSYPLYHRRYASTNVVKRLRTVVGNTNIVVGSDQSVEGFEFRTRGGRTYSQFMRAAKDVFKLRHEIDTRCSFHIHISLPRTRRVHDPVIQQAATEYLLEHMLRLPASVRARWSDVGTRRFIGPSLTVDAQKSSFVNFHQEFPTLEFRCFGNIDNIDDARRCLRMAVRAVRYAYRVKSGKAKMISSGFFNGRHEYDRNLPTRESHGTVLTHWYDLCGAAMSNSVPLSQQMATYSPLTA